MRPAQPFLEYFWSRVEKTDTCWFWRASLTPSGYGMAGVSPPFRPCRTSLLAHRVSYELHHGPISDGLEVCHSCDELYPVGDTTYRACINPEHLFLGTRIQNAADMARKGRAATGNRNGAYTHPERLARGDANGSRLHPESRPSGDAHPARRTPECLTRGDAHWTRLHPERLVGASNPSAKLTDEDVRLIRAIHAERMVSIAELAQRYSVTTMCIRHIVKRHTWRHVL